MLTKSAHPKNAKDDHSKMLNPMELMIVSRWVDTNYQFYGSYFGRHHPQFVQPDPANPAYNPADFRRKATFSEATAFLARPGTASASLRLRPTCLRIWRTVGVSPPVFLAGGGRLGRTHRWAHAHRSPKQDSRSTQDSRI